MPELPEVETFVRFLNQKIIDQTIEKVEILTTKLIKKPELNEFIQLIKGEKIEKVSRRGKYILIHLTTYVLLVHLRMEGKLIVRLKTKISSHPQYLSARFHLNNNFYLDFEDKRKFGTLHLESKKNYQTSSSLKKVGLEPFSNKLTPQYLKDHWKKTSRAIKVVLLEQNVIAGIGNIYVSEILFASQISPLRSANKISDQELKKIIFYYQKIMKNAIKMGGTTTKTFSVNDQPGKYWSQINVYQKTGLNCSNCQKIIKKIMIAGRGTYFCPKCQKK